MISIYQIYSIGNPTITQVVFFLNHINQRVDYAIRKKYNECAVGFLVNTSVLTLNHHGKLVMIN